LAIDTAEEQYFTYFDQKKNKIVERNHNPKFFIFNQWRRLCKKDWIKDKKEQLEKDKTEEIKIDQVRDLVRRYNKKK
jgi:hypothetical protein